MAAIWLSIIELLIVRPPIRTYHFPNILVRDRHDLSPHYKFIVNLLTNHRSDANSTLFYGMHFNHFTTAHFQSLRLDAVPDVDRKKTQPITKLKLSKNLKQTSTFKAVT